MLLQTQLTKGQNSVYYIDYLRYPYNHFIQNCDEVHVYLLHTVGTVIFMQRCKTISNSLLISSTLYTIIKSRDIR